MEPGISFSGSNSGAQIGINYGPINFGKDGLSDLQEKIPMIESAAFDSYDDQHEITCLPGTRADILNRIGDWASSPEERCIFWLCGMAGTGKSTICRTVATSLNDAKTLGASFFFKRGEEDRSRALKLFPTIARQLAISLPQLTPHIVQAIETDPFIATKAMKEQFDKLIFQPLQRLKVSEVSTTTVIIVIDALDECDGDNDIRLILQLLPQLQRLDSLQIRLFLTSRPELAIRLGFSKLAAQHHKDLILHDIPEEVIRHDISLFLSHRLAEIDAVPANWPGKSDFEKLVTLSVPLFIFAATVCRIFEDEYGDHPIDSLSQILAQGGKISSMDGGFNMDRVYLPVLDRLLRANSEKEKQQVPRKIIQEFQQIMGSIVLLESPLSITALSSLLEISERLLQQRLKLLHSVLLVPESITSPVRTFHLSFRDFLLDEETKEKTVFWIDGKAMHRKITSRCLFLCQKLRRNIFELSSEGIHRTELDRNTLERCLPSELQYACRYWIHHLSESENRGDMIAEVLSFLKSHFLHWVEVMGFLNQISEVLRQLNLLQQIATDENCPEMSAFLQDARRFILKNRQILDESPLQIYCAGLIFSPRGSIIRTKFETERPTWISQLPKTEDSWSAELQVLEDHSEWVTSVAFSPDGSLLASASRDATVKLWDVATGALKQTLGDDVTARWFQAVAFSPDGQLLASGSNKSQGSIFIWNTATGMCQETFTSDGAFSITFSPGGDLLVSAGDDYSVQIWNIETGTLQQTLDLGHYDWIRSLAFLPNGQLVSGSRDKTIRITDLKTGKTLHELTGHSSSINSVAVSPDGLLLASGSVDRLIHLWDPATGSLQRTLDGNYSRAMNSVTFSPDSKLLACGNADGSLQLWDTRTGAPQQILRHPDEVSSVVFSPDGTSLASACIDGSVRIWEVTRSSPQFCESHSDVVCTIALSPDAHLLASGSKDKTVRIWNVETGSLQHTLEAHHHTVEFVGFSPDGQLLATGGNDQVIYVWDVATGSRQRKFLNYESSIVFSPDSCLLAFAATDYSVHVCDLTAPESTTPDTPAKILDGHFSTVSKVAFSPDGQLLASSSYDEMVRLWSVSTGAVHQFLEGHTDSVRCVAFSPDGKTLASGSYDGTVRIWNTDGVPQRTFKLTTAPYSVRFGKHGSQIITNLGTIDLECKDEHDVYKLRETMTEISIQGGQSVKTYEGTFGEWVKLYGKRTLWLPPEARPVCSLVRGNFLALGHQTGGISVIGFHL